MNQLGRGAGELKAIFLYDLGAKEMVSGARHSSIFKDGGDWSASGLPTSFPNPAVRWHQVHDRSPRCWPHDLKVIGRKGWKAQQAAALKVLGLQRQNCSTSVGVAGGGV